jgi:hypothetical protein
LAAVLSKEEKENETEFAYLLRVLKSKLEKQKILIFARPISESEHGSHFFDFFIKYFVVNMKSR